MQNRKEYYPFFFYLKNSTKYFLIIKRAKRLEVTIVRPDETISIQCMDIDDGKVEISILENAKMRCSFFLQNGYTVEIKEKMAYYSDTERIAPILIRNCVEIKSYWGRNIL